MILKSAYIAAVILIATCSMGYGQESADKKTPKADIEKLQASDSYTVGWTLQCRPTAKEAVACEINNAIYSSPNKQQFLAVAIARNAGDVAKGRMVVQVVLPHGVNLESGATVQTDDNEPLALIPLTSDATGLVEKAYLNDASLPSLSKCKLMTFAFSGLDGKAYSVKFDCLGLPALLKTSRLMEK